MCRKWKERHNEKVGTSSLHRKKNMWAHLLHPLGDLRYLLSWHNGHEQGEEGIPAGLKTGINESFIVVPGVC
jgi:hypothetical protein